MSSSTAKYGIQYAQLADTVASLATTMQNLAGRVDLLLGESGQFNVTAAANTTASQAIALARTYPGNVGGSPPGIVIVHCQNGPGASIAFYYWVSTWTGTPTSITGFTIGMQFASAVAAKPMSWRFIPVL